MSQRCLLQSVVLATIVASAPRNLWSQQVQLVPPNDTVRVWASRRDVRKVKATVLPWSESTARFLTLSAPADSMDLPFDTVTRLEALRGKDTGAGIVTGAGVGGLLGTLIGGALGSAAVSDCNEFLCELNGINYVIGGLLIGSAVGAAIGGAAPPDRWARIELPTSAGFPEYRKPFHETMVFRMALLAVTLGLGAVIHTQVN